MAISKPIHHDCEIHEYRIYRKKNKEEGVFNPHTTAVF